MGVGTSLENGACDRGRGVTCTGDLVHARFENEAALNNLGEDVMHLVKVKDEIELTNVLKGAI